VWDLGCGVEVSGFGLFPRKPWVGFRDEGLECGIWGLGLWFWVSGLWIRVI